MGKQAPLSLKTLFSVQKVHVANLGWLLVLCIATQTVGLIKLMSLQRRPGGEGTFRNSSGLFSPPLYFWTYNALLNIIPGLFWKGRMKGEKKLFLLVVSD